MIVAHEPPRHIAAKIARRTTQWRAAKKVVVAPAQPLLTITFDDCPQSAARLGARVLAAHNVRATYFISGGLEGEEGPSGRFYDRGDLHALMQAGHEIGCHGYTHRDLSRAPLAEALSDVAANARAINAMGIETPGALAFPYGEASFVLKRALARRFACARGIAPGINRGAADAVQLRSFALYGARCSKALTKALDACAASKGWMIVHTHDVAEKPSRFGATPRALDALIRRARARGIVIESMSNAARLAFQKAKS